MQTGSPRSTVPVRSRGPREIDYNGRVPSAPGRWSWRSRLVKPLALVAAVGGLNALGAFAERQAIAPTDDACMTMLDYVRSAPGGEDNSDAWDRLRHVEGRLDEATAPEAVAIRRYLAFDRLTRGGGSTALVFEEDGAVLVDRVSARLMRAAQACTALGHPELEEYLHDSSDRSALNVSQASRWSGAG